MNSSEDDKLAFYLSFTEIILNTRHDDKAIILGDFNACVGADWETWGVLGKHGVGSSNSNGSLLLQMCVEMDLCVMNTMFQLKNKYKTTWMHPGSKKWHLIDYIFTRKRDTRDFAIVRVMRGVECWTDHRLLRAKVNFVVKPKVKVNNDKLPKRIDVNKRKIPSVRKIDNDEVNLILEEKRKAFNMLQNVDVSANRTVATYFKAVKATVAEEAMDDAGKLVE
ncbi:craniofacial development protein 2-like [Octopus bimaculoides]|uniref:craniofacial development protein 2-like n=1 Tax=Octopus bimaculoides TaxID=37653 RepID=UPI00071E15A6|nr:craniofacial development protein 2-like [Octopus bimaculoides]|eukprot:XP_014776948.1 PREDICTED: craniofacial development protein 2-like [Octopus bimaculoides]